MFRNLQGTSTLGRSRSSSSVCLLRSTRLRFVQRITPERIVDHMTTKIAEMGPPFAPPPNRIEKMRTEQMEALKNPIATVGTVVETSVGLFVQASIAAALCYCSVFWRLEAGLISGKHCQLCFTHGCRWW